MRSSLLDTCYCVGLEFGGLLFRFFEYFHCGPYKSFGQLYVEGCLKIFSLRYFFVLFTTAIILFPHFTS